MKKAFLFVPVFFFVLNAVVDTPRVHFPARPVAPAEASIAVENAEELHDFILEYFESRKFAVAASLLERMKQDYSKQYERFPYILLHAKALVFAGDLVGANNLYHAAEKNPQYSSYVFLPLARIAVLQNRPDDAIVQYRKFMTLRDHPDYVNVAREALDYCVDQKKPDDLVQLAQMLAVGRKSPLRRLSEFYIARSHEIRGNRVEARRRYLQLIHSWDADDATSLSLIQLDGIDGDRLTASERAARAGIAYKVWNFDLVKKYLEPVLFHDIKNAFYYARAIAFQGDWEGAKRIYQQAIDTWPNDPFTKQTIYYYAGASMRQGDSAKAEELYRRLRGTSYKTLDSNTSKLIQAVRAQGKLEEAIALLNPYCKSARNPDRQKAIFLRARIYYQLALYREAFVDLDTILKSKSVQNKREITFWKGLVMEKLGRKEDAIAIYKGLMSAGDFFSVKAREKMAALDPVSLEVTPAGFVPVPLSLPKLPGHGEAVLIDERMSDGNLLPAFLYLHLYEEASPLVTEIDGATWNILNIDPSDRSQKHLAIAYLAALCGNYSSATYYAEILLKTLPPDLTLFSKQVLEALFPQPYNEHIEKFANEREIDPLLILSIMRQESKFKRFARSQTFARGLMQLIPSTAVRMAGVAGLNDFRTDQLYEPAVNINLGSKYIQQLIEEFGNRVEVIAASYNSGEENVRRWMAGTSTDEFMEFFSNIDLPETKNYVMIVKTNYERYRTVYPPEPVLTTKISQ